MSFFVQKHTYRAMQKPDHLERQRCGGTVTFLIQWYEEMIGGNNNKSRIKGINQIKKKLS